MRGVNSAWKEMVGVITFATLLVMFIVISALTVQAKEQVKQKFKTTFTITFNEMTLDEAAAMEWRIKSMYEDACKIDVELEKVEGEIIWFDATGTDTIEIPHRGEFIHSNYSASDYFTIEL